MSFKETITSQDVVDLLNEVVRLDPQAATALVLTRVPCNEAVGNHPTIQVHGRADELSVGLLGILNGLFGIDEKGWGAVSCALEPDGSISEFLLLSSLPLAEVTTEDSI